MKEYFNKNINKILDLFKYSFYIIRLDNTKTCPCVNYETKQADPACEICLGTGKRISIKNITGASSETNMPATQRSNNNIMVSRSYYIPIRHTLERDDLIVDENEVFIIHEFQENRSFGGERIYNKCMAIRKKKDTKIFVENFNKILKGAGVYDKR